MSDTECVPNVLQNRTPDPSAHILLPNRSGQKGQNSAVLDRTSLGICHAPFVSREKELICDVGADIAVHACDENGRALWDDGGWRHVEESKICRSVV